MVGWVNRLLADAVQRGASDLHIESLSVGGRVRWRVDGGLWRGEDISSTWILPVITRLKVMGQMDIGQRRLPQDGRCTLPVADREVSLRIASLPVVNGERITIRILPLHVSGWTLSRLGLCTEQEKQLCQWLSQGRGLLIVTGPTGTGKTTTLYTMLRQLQGEERNLVTLEDPIEQLLPGVNQVQVHVKSGLTFAIGLRAILRHDPDAVMIGEIRDQETADIAIRAALAGNLVLTSLHTVDAIGAVVRLLDMGVAAYRVAAALQGVMAQRLLRRLCSQCRGRCCVACHSSGYRGRLGVFEMLPMDPVLRAKINRGASVSVLRQHIQSMGMKSLALAIRSQQQQGFTDEREVMRVVNSLGAPLR
ncbi:GspE/PulE family protein [Pasteuria penetrans]|uniref:GspE/PulE family protein n=1 Tax=Pasteuria penetrans TaxID=86005 RepID=UPI001FE3C18E|nr:GspE/PulE family protein [Pasteuria penetrans]